LASSTQEIYNGGSKAASAITYTFSCFAKYNGSIFTMVASDFATSGTTANFNLQTGTVVSITVGSTWSNGSAKIENYGNGWYRCIFTATSPSTTGLYISLTGTTYIWGCQIEQGAYVTSYVKTEAATVTRLADAASKTGISSLIGQTEGSVFFDFYLDNSTQPSDPVLWYMKDGGSGERYVESYSNGNLVYAEVNGSGVVAVITKTGLTIGRHKCAIAYKTNDFVFYVDGVQIGTDTSGTPSGFSTFGLQYYLSAYTGQQKVNQALVFKTRLTNAQLAELTTL
jgi:hypothetical protein